MDATRKAIRSILTESVYQEPDYGETVPEIDASWSGWFKGLQYGDGETVWWPVESAKGAPHHIDMMIRPPEFRLSWNGSSLDIETEHAVSSGEYGSPHSPFDPLILKVIRSISGIPDETELRLFWFKSRWAGTVGSWKDQYHAGTTGADVRGSIRSRVDRF